MTSSYTMLLLAMALQMTVHDCHKIDGSRQFIDAVASVMKRGARHIECPADYFCECSKTTFETLYCCTCIGERLPNGPTNCPDNCLAYCPTTGFFHCCYCDGVIVPRLTTTPTTTTTTTTTAAPSGGGGGCFPSTASVSLENGKSVTMSELQVGDAVQTASPDGSVKYTTVMSFLEKQPLMTMMYMSISTTGNITITLSENHLIYAKQNSADKFYAIYAENINIGDELLVYTSNELIPTNVVSVSTFKMQGVYLPITMRGNIIIDGVLASCYDSCHHDIFHIGMTPIQWFPEAIEWIFGNDKKFLAYVNILNDLVYFVL